MTNKSEPAAYAPAAVVIPVYNRPKLIQRTLEAVIHQTTPPQKIVVVDDGSTDETAAEAENFLKSHYPKSHWIVFRQRNQGVSVARNTGIALAGEQPYISFLDSDDIWPPDFLASGVSLLDENPNSAVAVSDREIRDIQNTPHITNMKELEKDPISWFFHYGAGILSCSIMRRKAVLRIAPFRPGMRNGQDFFFLVDLASQGSYLRSPSQPVLMAKTWSQPGEAKSLSSTIPHQYSYWATQRETCLNENPTILQSHLATIAPIMQMRWKMAAAHDWPSRPLHFLRARWRALYWTLKATRRR